jgi:hypothetical protein
VTVNINTEVAGYGSRAQDLASFGRTSYGVEGLTIVFPGKASLMFALARRVIEELDTRLQILIPLG